MSFFKAVPPPKTPLGRYRLLSPSAGVHVSPLQLGGMSIGNIWSATMGAMDNDASFKLLDAFYESGGNFIDTANNYQEGSSEKIIGEWMEKRGVRDQMVVATKYTTPYTLNDESIAQKVSYLGNNAKSLHISVDDSLKKLRTNYIDILYVHWWDWDTSIPELMNALNALVVQGKVIYLGISDTPAWIVVKANDYAREKGMSQFVIYQGAWNVMERSFEREIIPMAHAEGMALAPWNVLAGGKLRTDAEEKRRKDSGEGGRDLFGTGWERNEEEVKISAALEKVAKEVGAESITAVAIAYVMHKAPFVFPIIGGRKVEHLKGNIEALTLTLTPEQIAYLESVKPFDPGFPHGMIGNGQPGTKFIYYKWAGTFDEIKPITAIQPAKNQ